MKGVLIIMAFAILLAACSTQAAAPAAGQHKTKQQNHSNRHDSKQQKKGKNPQRDGKGSAAQKQQSTSAMKDAVRQADAKRKPLKPEYKMMKNYYIKPIDNADPKVVLLTIDDAPDKHAVEMAKTLKKLHAKAIFFIMGVFIDSKKGKEKLKEIHQMGFPVGDHTMTHPFLCKIPKAKQKEEIMSVYRDIGNILGQPPKFFRAPHGDNTSVSRKLTKEYNMLAMNWSYGYDWHPQYENPQALTHIMLNSPYLANGAILLMHDRAWTAKALPDIVKGLRKKGYKILDPALLRTPGS